MGITISTKQILDLLYILSWIIFIGLCIDAGGIIFNTFFTLNINPDAAKLFYKGIDMSSLYAFDSGYFLVETFLMSIVGVMKALLFYLIVKILHDKKLKLSEPFSNELRNLIVTTSYLTFGIGIFSSWGIGYSEWLIEQRVVMPDIQKLGFSGADVWLFMSVILFVIAQIFKKGIELQEESKLTI